MDEPLPSFPGAEGFGAIATGGRGGRVLLVTTLAAHGAGSLQAALDVAGPRIIVFRVSGVIEGDLEVAHGDLTIAGQTAPGAGVTIRGRLTGDYDAAAENIVIRHLRVRPDGTSGGGAQFDAIQFSRNRRLILDHVSASFAVDETVDLYEARDVTVQWSSIESSALSGHPEGAHNYGLISGPDGARLSLHHNLFAHHRNRNPAVATGPAEVVNNVAYNVEHGFIHHNPAAGEFNIVGNTFRRGPDAALSPFYFDDENGGAGRPSYFLADNLIDDPGSGCNGRIDDPWSQCDLDLFAGAELRATIEHAFAEIDGCRRVSRQSSKVAYSLVLAGAGAFPRDVVTARSVADTMSGGGAWGAYHPGDWLAGLAPTEAPADGDHDGMADDWERARGLDPNDGSDHRAILHGGYSAIETYVNELADALVASAN